MNEDEEEKNRKRLQVMANYAMIPFILGIPPILGWYIGSWLDKQLKISPYGKYFLLLLGIISGIREVVRIIKKYKDEEI